MDFGRLELWCLQKPSPYHALHQTLDCLYRDPQCVPTYFHTKPIRSGVVSNLSMVMAVSRDFVETDTSGLSKFRFAQSARQVKIRLPLKHFIYDSPGFSRLLEPTDKQLITRHAEYLPSHTDGDYLHHNDWNMRNSTKDKAVEEEIQTSSDTPVLTLLFSIQSNMFLVAERFMRYAILSLEISSMKKTLLIKPDLRIWPMNLAIGA